MDRQVDTTVDRKDEKENLDCAYDASGSVGAKLQNSMFGEDTGHIGSFGVWWWHTNQILIPFRKELEQTHCRLTRLWGTGFHCKRDVQQYLTLKRRSEFMPLMTRAFLGPHSFQCPFIDQGCMDPSLFWLQGFEQLSGRQWNIVEGTVMAPKAWNAWCNVTVWSCKVVTLGQYQIGNPSLSEVISGNVLGKYWILNSLWLFAAITLRTQMLRAVLALKLWNEEIVQAASINVNLEEIGIRTSDMIAEAKQQVEAVSLG